MKIKVLTLEVDHELKGIFQQVRLIENGLESFYKIIDCDLIEIVQIEVEGKFYDVICDEEFLLKEKPVPTLFIDNENVLCGNLIFTTCDEDGKTQGLTDTDIKILMEYILKQAFKMRAYLSKVE